MAEKEGHDYTIGRELYTAPDIFIYKDNLKTYKAYGEKYSCFDRFTVTDITYDGRTIATVTILNESNGEIQTFGETPKHQHAQTTHPTRKDVAPTPPTPEKKVTKANIDALKKTIEKKGVSISLVLGMAGVETLEGITPEEYNKVVKTVRGI